LVIAVVVAVLGQPVVDLYGKASDSGAIAESAVRSAGVATLLVGAGTTFAWGAASAVVHSFAAERPAAALSLRRLGVIVLVVGAALAVAVGVVFSGRIADKVSDQYHSFVNLGSDQGDGSRLITGGGNRYDFWRVAVHEFSDHPVGGLGAGNYAADYYQERRQDQDVEQPHSLPLQVLAELGLVGAALLAAFVVAVAVGLWRSARSGAPWSASLTVAAGGAFLGWLGTSAVDWVHLFPGLAGFALAAAAVLLVTDHSVPAVAEGRGGRALTAVAVVLAALAAFGVTRIALAENYRSDAAAAAATDPLGALTDTSESLSLDGDAVATYYVRSAAFTRLDRYNQARATLFEALQKDPKNFVTWALLGDLAFRHGDSAAARASYARASALNPQNTELRRLARDPSA
jgi:tetratricopeptide (TPR) repeat protein